MVTSAKLPSPEYEEFVEEFCARHPEVRPGKLFGMSSLTLLGKAFAGGFGAGLALKITEEDVQRILALSDTEPFDPSGRGRPMREWVVVGASHRSEWPTLADSALAVASAAHLG